MLRALQADNWLWQRADPRSDSRREAIHELVLEAFAPRDDGWQEAVVNHGRKIINAAATGLAHG